ncbi:MAG: hypothetical protein P8X63_02065 [Desulfuromonadaceae bacterium]
MSIKIGELLVREKLISLVQLEEALKYQVIFGGRLGTNLVEMGLLGEDDIARMLSKKLGISYLPNALTVEIPADVLALIPREKADEYQILPLRLDGRRLTLGMIDPSATKIINEMAFLTGCVIRPVIVPEIRMLRALEHHYQIEPRLSQVLLTDRSRSAQAFEANDSGQIWPESISGRPDEEHPEALGTRYQSAFITRYTIDEVSKKLATAENRDSIANNIAQYLGQSQVCGAVFLVRNDMALGWKGIRQRRLIAGFEHLTVPLQEPSVLKTVVQTQSYYLGPVPQTPLNLLILQKFGTHLPQTVLLVPLVLMGRTVGIIYANGDGDAIAKDLPELQKLASKAIMAFEILLLKNKILQT